MTASAQAAAVIREALAAADVEWEEPDDGTFVAVLPGQARLRTTVALSVGEHALSINAFVARRPDENHEAVYRWLLERNRRLYAVSFAIDALGDIYLVGRLPLAAVSTQEVDRVLGSVLEYADGSFNTILELGFASSIRREWAWRISRGESTANLAAFAHLAPGSGDGDEDAAPAQE
ncbi:MAG: YbjN domain-containing protein [Candidatus Nanopelagicales bacterium]|jgi:hypothetical protein